MKRLRSMLFNLAALVSVAFSPANAATGTPGRAACTRAILKGLNESDSFNFPAGKKRADNQFQSKMLLLN
jgi:hypothetical protein